jgi:hypothetical protein
MKSRRRQKQLEVNNPDNVEAIKDVVFRCLWWRWRWNARFNLSAN